MAKPGEAGFGSRLLKLALRQWGEEWGYGNMKVRLADRRDGMPVRKLCIQAHDGRELKLGDLTWIEGEEEQLPTRAAAE